MKIVQNSLVGVVTILSFSIIAISAQGLGNVKGKVTTPAGKKIQNVKVTARKDGKNLRSTSTDRNGKFRLTGLKAGRYNLVFEKYGYSAGVLYNVLIKQNKTNNIKNKNVYLTVDEGTLVIIKGSVFNQAGRSIYGAKVRIEEIRTDKVPRKKAVTYTSESGEFTFRFAEGTKKLRVTATARKVSTSKEIEVSEAAIYRLALTLNMPVKKK